MKLGFCGWLLSGVSLPEKIDFLASEGFSSVAWLQSIMDVDSVERAEAASLLRKTGFSLTYHGNVHGNLSPSMQIDPVFVSRMMQDVLWWHEHTNGVLSCCSDMISASVPHSGRVYLPDETLRLFQLQADFFEGTGIGYGIENAFRLPSGGGYCSIEDMCRMKRRLRNAPNAGMILDAGHANVYLNSAASPTISLDEYVREIPFKIYELHITDNHGLLDEHLLPGAGSTDFKLLRAGLEDRSFDGVISLEICPDILHGIYAWDISKEENRNTIRRAKDAFLAAFVS